MVPYFILAHLSHHLVTALPVPLLPFIRDEFARDYTRAGLVISAFGISYGFCQLPAGWLADRIGPRILITLSICGVAVTGLLIGFSQTYIMLISFLVLMGVLGGGYHPASTTMISVVVKPERLGQAMGFHMIGGGASFFLVPLIAAGIAAVWGWRGPFILLAIPTIIFGIIFHVFLRRQESTRKTKLDTASIYTETSPTTGRSRRLITVIVLVNFTQAMILSIIPFITLYLVDHFNISREASAASLSLIYSAGLWAGPVGGYLSDRWGRLPMILIPCFAAGVIIYLFGLVPYGWGIGATLIIIGMILYFNTTAAQAYIVDHTPAHRRSTILGFYFFGTLEGNGLLTPVIGYLVDQFGFQYSFTIVGAAVFAVALVSLIFLRINRSQLPAE